MHAVLGVTAYSRLIRCLIRHAAFLAEVHIEVCQVFDDNDIVFRSQSADDLQFLLRQAHPTRVVGVGEEHGSYTAGLEVTLQFGFQFIAAEVCYVKRIHAHADNLALLLLYRETGVHE